MAVARGGGPGLCVEGLHIFKEHDLMSDGVDAKSFQQCSCVTNGLMHGPLL